MTYESTATAESIAPLVCQRTGIAAPHAPRSVDD